MNHLEAAFEAAKKTYPGPHISRRAPCWCDIEQKEVQVPHIWCLVDAVEASFHTPERDGQLVLRELRPGCKTPFNHWGFMVPKSDVVPPVSAYWHLDADQQYKAKLDYESKCLDENELDVEDEDVCPL